jgi:hypothetical protein
MGPAGRGVVEVDENEVAVLGIPARSPLRQVVVVAGEDLSPDRHVALAALGMRAIGVGVAIDHVQVRTGNPTAQRPR